MYVALSADSLATSGGRPPPIKLPTSPPEPPTEDKKDDLVPSWARGVIAIGLVAGTLVFLLRVAEEQEKFSWRSR